MDSRENCVCLDLCILPTSRLMNFLERDNLSTVANRACVDCCETFRACLALLSVARNTRTYLLFSIHFACISSYFSTNSQFGAWMGIFFLDRCCDIFKTTFVILCCGYMNWYNHVKADRMVILIRQTMLCFVLWMEWSAYGRVLVNGQRVTDSFCLCARWNHDLDANHVTCCVWDTDIQAALRVFVLIAFSHPAEQWQFVKHSAS